MSQLSIRLSGTSLGSSIPIDRLRSPSQPEVASQRERHAAFSESIVRPSKSAFKISAGAEGFDH
jgi:hypothetical protein